MYIQNIEFEWDEGKNKANHRKHRISFEEAAAIFCYPIYKIVDTRFEYGEVRFIGIGRNSQMVVLAVIYTEQEAKIRIISARRVNKKEKQLYYDYCTQAY